MDAQDRLAKLTGQYAEFRSGLQEEARINRKNKLRAAVMLHRAAEVLDFYNT